MWVAFNLYIKEPLPVANTFLVACLDPRNGWFSAGFSRPWLNIYKGFSCPLAKGFSWPWLNISVGMSFFRLSITPIKSSDWNLALLGSQLTCKVCSFLTIHFFVKKIKWERKGCVCVVIKIAGFKYQWKPRDLLCRKTLPPGFKAYHLQRFFSSTPPQRGTIMAT